MCLQCRRPQFNSWVRKICWRRDSLPTQKYSWASLVTQLVKNLPAMWETWVWSLTWEDSPGGGKDYPLQYSDLENSMDCIVHGLTKSWTKTEWLSLSHTQAAVTSPEIALFLLLGSDIISRWKCLLCIFPTEESKDNLLRWKAWCLGKLQWYKVQVLGGHTSLDVADGKFPISGLFHCNEAVRIKWD